MKNPNVITIALAVGLAFSAGGAMAENMSKSKYEFLGKNLEANFRLASAGCRSLAGNANAICAAQAESNRRITKSELEAAYKPSVKTRYDARATKADADYSVATVVCDGKLATYRVACMDDAKAVKANQIADAMAEIRTSKPDVL